MEKQAIARLVKILRNLREGRSFMVEFTRTYTESFPELVYD
jgi:hypothetical protein